MRRRPALPSNGLGDLLGEFSTRLDRLERGYLRSSGGSFGLPFTLGNWRFELVNGVEQITDLTTGASISLQGQAGQTGQTGQPGQAGIDGLPGIGLPGAQGIPGSAGTPFSPDEIDGGPP